MVYELIDRLTLRINGKAMNAGVTFKKKNFRDDNPKKRRAYNNESSNHRGMSQTNMKLKNRVANHLSL